MKKNKLILYSVILSLVLSGVFGIGMITTQTTAYAQATPIGDGKIHNPLGDKTTTLNQVLNIVISTVQVIAGILAVVYLILAGLKFVLASGDPKKIETARNMLLYVVIGIAIIFGAQAISIVVQNTIGQVAGGK